MTLENDPPPSIDPDGRYTVTHDWTSPAELGTTVTMAVAAATGVSPDTVAQELSKTVDCDGLDQLFRPPEQRVVCPGGHLVLSVAGCRVTIGSDGAIVVEQ